METKQQIDHLIELAIVQRAELKKLVDQLPILRGFLLEQINATIEDMEPALRSDLIEFCDEKTDRKVEEIRAFFNNAKAEFKTKSESFFVELEKSAQARFEQLRSEREIALNFAEDARKNLEAAANAEAAKIPAQVAELVTQELARFPRAGEIDQLRKEFSEPRGLNPRGKWKSTETYQKLDLVAYNGDSYVSNVDDNRERPSRSSVSWTLSAARGAGGGGGGITSLNDILGNPTSDLNIVSAEGSNYVRKTLTAGTNVTIAETADTITISSSDVSAETLTATVTNAESVAITRGQVVYVFGATGNRVSVKLASNAGESTSSKTFGVVSDDSIAAGATGTVTCVGVVDKLNLGTYTEGATVYLGSTAGTFTATKPQAPNHLVYVGFVERANNGNGELYVKIQNGYELDEIHDVQITAPKLAGQTILYDQTNSLWKNANISGTSNQITVTNADAAVTLSLPTSIINVNSLTASTATNLTLTGGSTGASLTLGQGINSNITLTPNGTGVISYSTEIRKLAGTTGYFIFTNDGGGNTGFYYPGSNAIDVYSNSVHAMRVSSSRNLLLGTTTDSSNGRIQLATHTTSAGGIGFGTDTSLYRSATGAGALEISAASGVNALLSFALAGTKKAQVGISASNTYFDYDGTLIFRAGVGGTQALTIDSSQQVKAVATTDSTSTTTGALVTSGGLGVAKKLFVGDDATFSNTIVRNGSAGSYRVYNVQSSGVSRWAWGADNAAESGSNAGSDFVLYSFNDAGSVLTNPVLKFTRSTSATTLAGNLTAQGTGGITATAATAVPITALGTSGYAGYFLSDGFLADSQGNTSTHFVIKRAKNTATQNRWALQLQGGENVGDSPVDGSSLVFTYATGVPAGSWTNALTLTRAGAATLAGNLTVSGTGTSNFAGQVYSTASSGTYQFKAQNSSPSGTNGAISSAQFAAQPGYNTFVGTTADGTSASYQGGSLGSVITNTQGYLISDAANGILIHGINNSIRFATGNTGSLRGSFTNTGASTGTFTLNSGTTAVINDTTDSSSTTTGAIITSGGIGAAKKIYSGDTIQMGSSNVYAGFYKGGNEGYIKLSQNNSTNQARIEFYTGGSRIWQIGAASGGVTYNAGEICVYNENAIGVPAMVWSQTQTKIPYTTDSTSSTTGSLITSGGLGVAKDAYFGNTIVVSSSIYAGTLIKCSSTTDSSSTTTGAIQTSGGLGVAKKATFGGGINGTTTNDSAASGCVGEYVSSTVVYGSRVSNTTGTYLNVTSISLTAGDWDVTGSISFNGGSATISSLESAVSVTSGNVDNDYEMGQMETALSGKTGKCGTLPTGTRRISIASTTTVYLVSRVYFSAGTVDSWGVIRARRAR